MRPTFLFSFPIRGNNDAEPIHGLADDDDIIGGSNNDIQSREAR